jgi:predicted Zn-dependent protease
MISRLFALLVLLPLLAFPDKKPQKQAVVNIQKTSLTRDQETQIGQQAAAQVEKEMEVVRNSEVEAWLNQIGQQLAKTPQANAYPYYFKLVNEDSINAFALPGGPMYVHTGLIRAADNEGEVAGVLAHEMSHVALRHGAAQMSKQQTWGAFLGLVGAAAGSVLADSNGGCGMLCQAAQKGVGLGGSSLLMKFSRGYEHDADLNGARMMNSAGYDPMGLPTFFQKLEATMGTAVEPKGLALWMSSHPATGSRVEYVSQDIQFYPKQPYGASTGNFAHIKGLVAKIPPAKLKPAALLSSIQATPRQNLPAGLKDFSAKGFSVAYPSAWQAGQAEQGGGVYLIPQGGAAKAQNGSVELLAGAMIDYYVPAKGADSTRLDSATGEFIDGLKKGDQKLRADRSESTSLDGQAALRTKLTSKASNGDQVIYLYTTARQAGLWYMVQAGGSAQMNDLDPAFRQMAQTVMFPKDAP